MGLLTFTFILSIDIAGTCFSDLKLQMTYRPNKQLKTDVTLYFLILLTFPIISNNYTKAVWEGEHNSSPFTFHISIKLTWALPCLFNLPLIEKHCTGKYSVGYVIIIRIIII